ncbi:MAG: hypothetical protein LBE99_01205, partial [Puniceicoccales bacterium]|nr:hypothetical protein [Puniceicoccales bacterium]
MGSGQKSGTNRESDSEQWFESGQRLGSRIAARIFAKILAKPRLSRASDPVQRLGFNQELTPNRDLKPVLELGHNRALKLGRGSKYLFAPANRNGFRRDTESSKR